MRGREIEGSRSRTAKPTSADAYSCELWRKVYGKDDFTEMMAVTCCDESLLIAFRGESVN
jgi:hypothetical protein